MRTTASSICCKSASSPSVTNTSQCAPRSRCWAGRSHRLRNQLRLSRRKGKEAIMAWTEDDARRVGTALLSARRKLQSLNGEKPTGGATVFQVVKDAMDIERRMKVRTP